MSRITYSWNGNTRRWTAYLDGVRLRSFVTLLECEQWVIAECERREQAS